MKNSAAWNASNAVAALMFAPQKGRLHSPLSLQRQRLGLQKNLSKEEWLYV